MKIFLATVLSIFFFSTISYSQNIYPNNEDGEFEDMLTPLYYLSENGSPFRNEVNKLIYFARMERFQHPLADSTGQIPQYTIPTNGEFGAGKGPTRTQEHHSGIDIHVGNNETKVNMYASYDGYVAIYRDAPKYRHYLSITKNIGDSTGNILGKMVSIYAHIDLDLDSTSGLLLNGKFVNEGDLVSKHFYSGTVGGPHIQFEVRYYYPEDIGNEEFYGFVGPLGSSTLTEPSAGSWSYGYWNPNVGYGYANPNNHMPDATTSVQRTNGIETPQSYKLFQNYPNPFNPSTVIRYKIGERDFVTLKIYNSLGEVIETLVNKELTAGSYEVTVNAKNLVSGIYFYALHVGENSIVKKMVLLR